jgi:hypothetical protein
VTRARERFAAPCHFLILAVRFLRRRADRVDLAVCVLSGRVELVAALIRTTKEKRRSS